jgi:hypothetical protein
LMPTVEAGLLGEHLDEVEHLVDVAEGRVA